MGFGKAFIKLLPKSGKLVGSSSSDDGRLSSSSATSGRVSEFKVQITSKPLGEWLPLGGMAWRACRVCCGCHYLESHGVRAGFICCGCNWGSLEGHGMHVLLLWLCTVSHVP